MTPIIIEKLQPFYENHLLKQIFEKLFVAISSYTPH